jgi:cell division protein FtsB
MWKKTGYLTAAAILSVYIFIAFRGPQGIPALAEKRKQVVTLQSQNADLIREIQEKREYVNRLKNSQQEQELEIRKRLKMHHPGDTVFILPDQPKAN